MMTTTTNNDESMSTTVILFLFCDRVDIIRELYFAEGKHKHSTDAKELTAENTFGAFVDYMV